MEKLIALAVLVLASLACGAETVGTMKPLATEMPTVRAEPLAAIEKPLATPTDISRDTIFVVGSHNLRACGSFECDHLQAWISDEYVTVLKYDGWLLIETVGRDVNVCGWIRGKVK